MRVSGGLRFKRCPDCGELHDRDDWPDNHRRPDEAVCAPMVIRDELPVARQSQVTGQLFDSKRGLRATYQPSGNPEGKLYQEIGTEKQKPYVAPKPDHSAIRDSIAKAKARISSGEVSRETYAKKVITRPGPVLSHPRKERAI